MAEVVLDVAIGLVLVYLLFSGAVSALESMRARVFRSRGAFLREELERMLDQEAGASGLTVAALKRSDLWALVVAGQKAGKRFPEWIEGQTLGQFVYENVTIKKVQKAVKEHGEWVALAAVAAKERTAAQTKRFGELKQQVMEGKLRVGPTDFMLARLEEESDRAGDRAFYAALEEQERLKRPAADAKRAASAHAGMVRRDTKVRLIGQWFDDRMQAVSATYRRRARVWLFFLALGLVLAFNVDTLHIVDELYRDAGLRASLAGQAEATVDGIVVNETAAFPIGWDEAQRTWLGGSGGDLAWGWVWASVGWLLSAGAVSLGAPFWYDLLGRLVAARRGLRSQGGGGVAVTATGVPGVAAPPLPPSVDPGLKGPGGVP